MSHAFQTVLWMLLQLFAPRHNAQIRFLKAQIEILRRRLPGERIVPRPAEKAELLRIGAEFGQEVMPVLGIVRPETYRRWMNDAKRGKQLKKSGRPHASTGNCATWWSGWGKRTSSGATAGSWER